MTPIPEERQVWIRHRNYVEAYLVAEAFQDVLVDGGVTGTDTLMSIDKAHRLLGYTPDFT